MNIFNTLSGKKEKLTKPNKRPLRLFVCGPTVFDVSHIGHARTYLAFDVLVRYLRAQDYKVFYLQNITNVDDKIIARAKRENKNPLALAEFFEQTYYKDMKALNVTTVDKYARATDFIPQIVRQVQTLIKKGYAYKIPGDGYYFDIAKFKDYGKLSHRTALQAEDAVSRIDESVGKRNKGDFCLWKFYEGIPSWPTPLGQGRPGWHIEDTAISEKYFGPQYDLHGGAQDLKFPHHEAEIAQQEAASGKKPFVKIWLHTGFLRINGEKMSKSLNNFVSIQDFLKTHSPNVLRWLVLNHHYRSPVNYTKGLIEQNENSLMSMEEFLSKLDFVAKTGSRNAGTHDTTQEIKKTDREFNEALADDLNTPRALARLFRLATFYQEKIWQLKASEAKTIGNYLKETFKNLGLLISVPKIPQEIFKLARERELLRQSKQFVQADALRKKIIELGYEIQDTPLGPWPKPIP